MTGGRIAVRYDTWAELAVHECASLQAVAAAAEHVGRTALPGAHGRDVIDVIVGVRMLERRGSLVVAALEQMGYQQVPSRIPGAIELRKRGAVAFDAFLVELGGREWKRAIALRDYLRRHADEARSYSRRLQEAEAATPDEAAYAQRKATLIASFAARAEAWRLSHPRD